MKVTYFNVRARAETARLILAQAGVEYEDSRIEFSEWADLKANAKWGSLPVLEDGDLCLGQSTSIARYLANKYGLAGKDSKEQFSCDVVIDTIGDWYEGYYKYQYCKDEEEKAKNLEDFKKNGLVYLAAMAKHLEDKGGKYMVGDALTWADIAVFNLMFDYKDKEETADMKEQMAPLTEIYHMVAALPNIKKWVETRPESSM